MIKPELSKKVKDFVHGVHVYSQYPKTAKNKPTATFLTKRIQCIKILCTFVNLETFMHNVLACYLKIPKTFQVDKINGTPYIRIFAI